MSTCCGLPDEVLTALADSMTKQTFSNDRILFTRDVSMKCRQCGRENAADAHYCLKCGAKLSAVCPRCGRDLPAEPNVRFCPACGFQLAENTTAFSRPSLTQSQGTEEIRRHVTVLFADLTGFTALSERMDPEDLRELQDAYFTAVSKPISTYGGNVEKYIGDAVLAVFGVPESHEDDPERAIHAALAMQEAMDNLNQPWAGAGGEIPPLQLRIGVHTGLVVSRVNTDEAGDFVVTGDTVNLASRLQNASEPGTVLVSAESARLAAHAFQMTNLGAIPIKGKAEPVGVFRVVGPKATPTKPRGLPGLTSPMVGRQAEMATLGEALERLQRGVGGIVTVVGEAGIGKSRLVADSRKWQVTGGGLESGTDYRSPITANWIEGRCLSYGATLPYLLWLDVLRSALGVTLDDASDVVAERLRAWVQDLCLERCDAVYPYLARLMSLPLAAETLADLAEMDGDTLKQRTFQAVETVLAYAASRQPLAVALEDLHWADPSSLELLERLLPLTDHTSLLLICVFRPHVEHGSWRIRETAARNYRHRHADLWLQPLSAADSETLVGNLLAVDALPQALRWRILSRAEGNPFFVEEVIRTLIDRKAIALNEATGCWLATRDLAEIPIPETLQGVIAARINHLQADTRRMLQLASVIGRIFLYRVLAEIAQEERNLEGELLALQHQDLIRERARIPDLEYIFKHELTREATYDGILKRQRKIFHRQVAEALERIFSARLDEQAGLLAHHWEQAGDFDQAVHYLVRAGDQARQAYATDEAEAFYGRAVQLLERQGAPDRLARVLMKLGTTFHGAFDFERSRQAYDRVFALWGERPAPAHPPAPHALRYAVAEAMRLDPTRSLNVMDSRWHYALFAGLTHVDADGEVIPDLARRWQVLDGGHTYVFELREDACWSDGRPVTAQDFVCGWKRTNQTYLGLMLVDIRGAASHHRGDSEEWGVQVRNDTTLVIQLEEPASYFLHLLGMPSLFALPNHVLEAYGEAWTEPSHLVTSGPFRLEASLPGTRTVLVRNPDFSGLVRGNVDRVEVLHPGEGVDLAALYAMDELDILDLESPEQTQWAQQNLAEEYLNGPAFSTYSIAFQLDRPPFDDVRVRQAFAHSVNKVELPSIRSGSSQPGIGGFVPPGVPGHSPGIGLGYDPDLARQLLAQAGYPGGQGFPQVQFGFGEGSQVGDVLMAQWQHVLGVTLTPQPADRKELFYSDIIHLRPIRLYGWEADYLDPDNFLRVATSLLIPGLDNLTYNRLIRAARLASDQRERLELLRHADRILVEQALIVPLSYGVRAFLCKPWVRAYRGTLGGGLRDIVVEPH